MATDPSAKFPIHFTAAEERWEKRFNQLAEAAFGSGWREVWPDHTEKTRPLGSLSELKYFGSLDKLILRAEQGKTGRPAICFVESITIPWVIRLGNTWNIDPQFFINHVRPLDTNTVRKALYEACLPNEDGGLSSFVHDSGWITISGHVDHGKPENTLEEDYDFPNTTKRQHACSILGDRLSHTKLSIYEVEEGLHLILTDMHPKWANKYIIREMAWLPEQVIVRLATLDSTGHLALPFLHYTLEMGIIRLWDLLSDDANKKLLLVPLQNMDIDVFVYRAALVQCENELNLVTQDLYEVQILELNGQEYHIRMMGDSAEKCIDIDERALARLKTCISENRRYEHRTSRTSGAITASSSEVPCSFGRLMEQVTELEYIIGESRYRAQYRRNLADRANDLTHITRLSPIFRGTWKGWLAINMVVVPFLGALSFKNTSIGWSIRSWIGRCNWFSR